MKTTVICIGDSITEGVGSSDWGAFSYPSQMSLILCADYEIVNCGRNGATLTPPPDGKKDDFRGLPHYEKAKNAAEEAKAKGNGIIVSIMLGTNDADIIDYGFEGRGDDYYNRYHDVFVSEMLGMVDDFRNISENVRFVIALSPYSYDNIKHTDFGNLENVWKYQKEIIETVKSRGIDVAVCDMSAATAPSVMTEENVSRYYLDRLHPNDLGHMYFAHFFANAVLSLN